jgi:hypothetical protein
MVRAPCARFSKAICGWLRSCTLGNFSLHKHKQIRRDRIWTAAGGPKGEDQGWSESKVTCRGSATHKYASPQATQKYYPSPQPSPARGEGIKCQKPPKAAFDHSLPVAARGATKPVAPVRRREHDNVALLRSSCHFKRVFTTISPGAKLDALQRAPQGCAPGMARINTPPHPACAGMTT